MWNLPNLAHFEKFIFIQQWLTQNMWSIETIICIFNKKNTKHSIQKFLYTKKWKGLKKIHIPSIK
jgi:hypothetical protein